jgi:hypothetical protein
MIPTNTVTISEARDNPPWWKNHHGMTAEAKLIKKVVISGPTKKSLRGRTYCCNNWFL